MEKYRIAVGIPTLKDCSLEAIAYTEHLSRKGISAEWENKDDHLVKDLPKIAEDLISIPKVQELLDENVVGIYVTTK